MGRKLNKNIFDFLKDLISFGTPQAIVFNIFLIFLIFSLIPTTTIENTHSVCIFKNIILPIIYENNCPTQGLFANCECPACGMTRAMSSILHLKFKQAYNYNKFIFPLILAMIIILITNSIKSINIYKKEKRII